MVLHMGQTIKVVQIPTSTPTHMYQFPPCVSTPLAASRVFGLFSASRGCGMEFVAYRRNLRHRRTIYQ